MTGWIVETLIASSVLMLVVLALRGPVARSFGPHAAYLLWLLPLARMVLPPLPAGAMPAPMATLPALDVDAIVAHALAARHVVPDAGIDMGPALLAIWAGGALLYLLWQLATHRLFMARTMRGAEPLPAMDRDRVEVCASRAAEGPLAAGIFVKSIVLPADWRRRYAADELRLAMAHEFAHHRRCDLSANLVALLTLAVHWFNPIAHIAYRAFRADQELACDAVVLAGASPQERHVYASALVKSAIGRRPVALCPFGARDDLKRRLRMLRHHRPGTHIGTALVLTLGVAGLAVTASGSMAAETGREVAETTAKTIQAVALPLAPSAPDAPGAPDALDPPAPPAVHVERIEQAAEAAEAAHADIAAASDAAWAAGEDAERAGEAIEQAVQVAMVRHGPGSPSLQAAMARTSATVAVAAMADARIKAPAHCVRRIAHSSDGDATQVSVRCDIDDAAVERSAQLHALSALTAARVQIERAHGLTDEQRSQALEGIEQGVSELRANLAD